MDFEIVNPDPSGTIASLRSLGYSVQSAIADLVDNCLAAQATSIDVLFTWDGRESWVAVVDDGQGMDEDTLIRAMTIAGTGEQSNRAPQDLGRFGMGLKTASFSQANRLTVSSAPPAGGWTTRSWDLELVRTAREWRLLRGATVETDALLAALRPRPHGTVILWQGLHRFDLPEVDVHDTEAQRQFYAESQRVEGHLGMVFVRYLSGEHGAQDVTISLNRTAVTAWDPFMRGYPATRERPTEELLISGQSVRVTPYVLPHHGRFSQDEYVVGGGPAGWLDQQGFYVFRRDRLILAGDWLALRGLRRDEKYNLARIAIDVPAELDRAWAVDVRKSAVVPPVTIRDSLRRIARNTRESAREVITHRGKVHARAHGADFIYPWSVNRRDERLRCTINRQHPLVAKVLQGGGEHAADTRALLRLIEETVPVATLRILHETETDDDPEPFEESPSNETLTVARRIYDALLDQGATPNQARRRLAQMEPFDRIDGFWRKDSPNSSHYDEAE